MRLKAKSMAVPSPLLVVTLPSMTTLSSDGFAPASPSIQDGYAVAFLPSRKPREARTVGAADVYKRQVILIVIALAGVRLIYELTEIPIMDMDIDFFTQFLANALSLVVGVEFVKMLCQHSCLLYTSKYGRFFCLNIRDAKQVAFAVGLRL